MKKEKKLWLALALVLFASFLTLGYYGIQIYQQSPPIPEKIITTNGDLIFTKKDIMDGKNVWQSMGGQEIGSIWGHGAYQAPDWTADWLHKEATLLLAEYSEKIYFIPYDKLDSDKKSLLKIRLQKELRANTYSKENGNIIVSDNRARAIKNLCDYYQGLFMNNPEYSQLRDHYAIPENTIKDPEKMRQMNAFFFWATWATVTERPGTDISYTHNWPYDELVGNKATADILIWSGVSIILLILCIGILAFYHAQSKEDSYISLPNDPLIQEKTTPSMKRIKKYVVVVGLLMILQVMLGIITAHYGVEGSGLYGIPLNKILPYSVTRTWHTQLAIFWIATAWLATGLYMAPALSGKDPKFQSLGVDFLFYALLIIVFGSMTGQWLAIMQKLNPNTNFWLGHQGFEYVDLGRFWQLFLFIGLLIWLILMTRPIIPVLKENPKKRSLLLLFLISCISIALFYAAGLMWGQHTHLSISEYWRWWVVHLWVEGFFEVFATVVIAFLFVRMGLLKEKTATINVLFSTIIFLSGGIIGTFHHLYFTGTTPAVMALGACFSALEVVPLTLIGFEAFENYKASQVNEWMKDYKWPIYFMVSVAFWNFLGAGVFGFLINPPIALYYLQGLNTTALHAHTALFGVYGMLGIGFILFVLRSMYRNVKWNDTLLKLCFWSLNIGLLLMGILSLLPIGIWQAIESIDKGMWYARSSELMQKPEMILLKWLRSVGDTIFAVGIFSGVIFIFRLCVKKIS
ncbi:nitric-oxide reductase large subunit [Apibacter sp. HY039]|uniref:nitric-oxide reductase large subunit n=1 Tax=Apibacter sp. HY039 TaxID=2501476 RepID=UPI000FEBB317|nr:nitric-oxide reductase large subunit [Apibacter sp. HY039]